jgi:Leucine-rich repeat (LRR) protein
MKQAMVMVVALSSLLLVTVLTGCIMPPSAPAELDVAPPAATQTGTKIVTFPDKNLELAIREALSEPADEEILSTELTQLTELKVWSQGITDLASIEYCTNLNKLGFWRNPISDVSPISSLTSLTDLHLCDSQISDIHPLSSLTNLTWLAVASSSVIDISPLSSLTNLTVLDLASNQISDLSPLLANTGLGAGDTVLLGGNNLDLSPGSEDMENIGILEARGVVVSLDPQQWAPEHVLQGAPVPVPTE